MICGALPMVDISTIRFIEVTITSSRLNISFRSIAIGHLSPMVEFFAMHRLRCMGGV